MARRIEFVKVSGAANEDIDGAKDVQLLAVTALSAAEASSLPRFAATSPQPCSIRLPLSQAIRNTWGREPLLMTRRGLVRLHRFFFLNGEAQARQEQELMGDVVVLEGLPQGFGSIWVKTAAILSFGAEFLRNRGQDDGHTGKASALRFLMKCDDDAFVDIEEVVMDILVRPPVGVYWGHVMALVEPNRIEGDKYYVPHAVYPMEYYPPYARGMCYALSEDLVLPLGTALSQDRISPFPYREDVSVGLYLLELARRGEVRVVPQQRKDAMPIDVKEHCLGTGDVGESLLVLHRYRLEDAGCFWDLIQSRRRNGQEASERMKLGSSSKASPGVDFCRCMRSNA